MTIGDADTFATTDPDGSALGADAEPGGAMPGGGAGPERFVQEGLDHLQRAVRETIAAMRAVLDLAEDLVEDPRAAEALVATIGSVAEAAVRSGGQKVGTRFARAAAPDDDDDGGRVQRIPVS